MAGCRPVEGWRRGRTWRGCVDEEVGLLGLHPGWAMFKDVRFSALYFTPDEIKRRTLANQEMRI